MHHAIKALVASLALLWAAAALAAVEKSDLRTWTHEDGRQMEAELIDLQGDLAVFRRSDGRTFHFPVHKLAEDDRVYISENEPSAGATGSEPAPEREPSKVARALNNNLVTSTGSRRTSRLRDYKTLENADYYALYYSARWCGPCRQFTPDLVRTYNQLKREHENFELIFVSSDRSSNEMAEYMSEYSMPWPAIDFNRRNRVDPASANWPRAIPTLIVLNRDGEVVAPSGGGRTGARQVLAELENLLNDS